LTAGPARARTGAAADARNLREEIQLTLSQLGEAAGNRIGHLVTAQGEKLDTVSGQITALTEGNERRQETLRINVEAKLIELKTDAATSASPYARNSPKACKPSAAPLASPSTRSPRLRGSGSTGYRRAQPI
jgi:hypothetical protein